MQKVAPLVRVTNPRDKTLNMLMYHPDLFKRMYKKREEVHRLTNDADLGPKRSKVWGSLDCYGFTFAFMFIVIVEPRAMSLSVGFQVSWPG